MTDCRFQFHKRGQLFIRAHNETLPVAAMCVNNQIVWLRPSSEHVGQCSRHGWQVDEGFISALSLSPPSYADLLTIAHAI
jgi:hypothetical protein